MQTFENLEKATAEDDDGLDVTTLAAARALRCEQETAVEMLRWLHESDSWISWRVETLLQRKAGFKQ